MKVNRTAKAQGLTLSRSAAETTTGRVSSLPLKTAPAWSQTGSDAHSRFDSQHAPHGRVVLLAADVAVELVLARRRGWDLHCMELRRGWSIPGRTARATSAKATSPTATTSESTRTSVPVGHTPLRCPSRCVIIAALLAEDGNRIGACPERCLRLRHRAGAGAPRRLAYRPDPDAARCGVARRAAPRPGCEPSRQRPPAARAGRR